MQSVFSRQKPVFMLSLALLNAEKLTLVVPLSKFTDEITTDEHFPTQQLATATFNRHSIGNLVIPYRFRRQILRQFDGFL